MPAYFYYLFGAEGLAISAILVFLFMSQFNKKSARYVFGTAAKKAFYILIVGVMTGGIMFTCIKTTLPKPEPTMGVPGSNGPMEGNSMAYSALNEFLQYEENKNEE